MRHDINPFLVESLALQLGHEAPYSETEVDSLGRLTSRGGHAPYGLQLFPSLRMLSFVGCGDIDLLRDEGHRPLMFKLKSWTSGLGDIDGIAQLLPNLKDFEVNMGLVKDLRPLLELDRLERVQVSGCPLDEHSYREIYPYLVKKGILNDTHDDAKVRPQEWELMNAFKRRDLKLSAFCAHDTTLIAAPGHTVYDNPYGKSIDIALDDAYDLLEKYPDADEATYIDKVLERRKELRGW